MTLRLPSDLIDGPFVIWVDGEQISDFEHVIENDVNIVVVSLTENSKLITIMGTTIVPEFGAMTMIVLGISILSILILGQKMQLSKRF